MKFSGVTSFISSLLPSLVSANVKKQQILFATYNSISGYQTGQVKRTSRNIRIESGNYPVDPFQLGLLSFALATGDDALSSCIVADMRRDGKAHQELARKGFAKSFNPTIPQHLVFVYAGYTAFESAFAMAQSIKESSPDAVVVVLTCDCDLQRKDYELGAAMSNGKIDHYIVSRECGGRNGLREILDAILVA